MLIGSINCALREIFTKLAKLQAKQNFAFAIVTGDLFGEATTEASLDEITALLQGNISVPLPTYFTVGDHALPQRVVDRIEEKDEVCENLYYLGRRGTLKTSEGIRIVALGGKLAEAAPESEIKEKYLPYYTEKDAKVLNGVHTADILLTNEWPLSIRVGSKIQIAEGVQTPKGQQCIADLVSTLKPRYHITSSLDLFYEREPFFHSPSEDAPDVKPLTRFINLASFNGASGQKALYAFSLDLTAPPLVLPAGATASPLPQIYNHKKRVALEDQSQSYSRFSTGDPNRSSRHNNKRRRNNADPSECFFCLSNTQLATHLIASIGTDVYLTTAKGPLPKPDTFSSLQTPGHILIIPLSHSATISAIPDPAARTSTYQEMTQYRRALQSMIHEKSNGTLGAITWEVSRAHIRHIHWQFLPIATDTIKRGLVDAAFMVEAENQKYQKFEKRDIGDGVQEKSDYFRVWIWSGVPDENSAEVNGSGDSKGSETQAAKFSEKQLVLPMDVDARFDMQFGRKVMAKLLALDDRMDWRNCVQTVEEETKDVETFKEAFKPFDFSLEDE